MILQEFYQRSLDLIAAHRFKVDSADLDASRILTRNARFTHHRRTLQCEWLYRPRKLIFGWWGSSATWRIAPRRRPPFAPSLTTGFARPPGGLPAVRRLRVGHGNTHDVRWAGRQRMSNQTPPSNRGGALRSVCG